MKKGTAKKAIRLLFFLLILILSPEVLSTQTVEIEFNTIRLGKSEHANCVYSIFQDSQDFLWIGTFNSLLRYDGHELVEYKRNSSDPGSLFGTAFNAICEDSHGTLWISSDGALSRFDREKQTFANYRYTGERSGSLSNNVVNTVYLDRSANLWVGTDQGLNLYDQDSDSFVLFEHDPDDPRSLSHDKVTAILEDSSEKIWIGTYGGGLDLFDRETGSFVHFRHDPKNPKSLSDDRVWSLAEVSGVLWVGTDGGGLNRFDREGNAFIRYNHDPENSKTLSSDRRVRVVSDRKGDLWVGTEHGLSYLKKGSDEFVRYAHDVEDSKSLRDDRIRCLHEDRSGVLWIGTVKGLQRADRRTQHFRNYLSGDKILGICQDSRGILWVGTQRGLVRLEREKEELFRYRADPSNPHSLTSDSISSVFVDSTDTLWVGTLEGLDRLDRETGEFLHYTTDFKNPNSLSKNEVTAIVEDSRGELWFGTYGGGLNLFDREQNAFIRFPHGSKDPFGFLHPSITQLFEDNSGNLWIATLRGLFRMDRKNRRFVNYRYDFSNPKSVYHLYGKGICQDRSGRVWAASGTCLYRYDQKKDELRRIDRPDFVDFYLYGLIADDHGYLWIMTDNRLIRWNPESDATTTYELSDGINCLPFVWRGGIYTNPSGEVFLGGQNGMVSFYPERMVSNYQPNVVLTSIEISGRKIEPVKAVSTLDDVELSWRDSHFRLKFAALDFVAPYKNQYAYVLEGYDEDWNFTGLNRTAEYSGIPAGNYLLKVKATNRDGVWNDEQHWLLIDVHVLPHPLKSWWAFGLYILLAVVAAAGAVSVYRRFRRRISEPSRIKQTLTAEPTRVSVHAPRYELFLLGFPRLMREGKTLKIGRKKAFAVLVYLALNNGSVQNEFLAELLWPNNIKNRKNLRTTIACLKADLGEQLVRRNDTQVELDPEIGLFADVLEIGRFAEAFEQSMNESAPPFHLLEQAAELLKGGFLDGFYLKGCPEFENWLVLEQNKIEQIGRFTLSALIEHYEPLKEYERAIAHARRLINLDPTDEQAHRILIRLYTRTGQKQLALRQYKACVRILESEMGTKPNGETKALLNSLQSRS